MEKFLTKKQWTTLGCMYGGYGAMMISRQMVTILSPALLVDESLEFNVQNLGDILAFGTIGALIGKMVWGPLGDKIGGRLTFLIGIVVSALLVTAFGISYSHLVFTLVAALLYGVKSAGWPGMTKLVGNWYQPSQYGTIWSILSTSSRASVVAGTLVFGWLLSQLDWRMVAFMATGFSLLVYGVCRFYLKERPDKTDSTNGATREGVVQKSHFLDGTNLAQGLIQMSKSMRFWSVIVMLMALTCAMAFLDFLSAFLLQVHKLSASDAAMASSAMPMGSLLGLIASIFFYDRLSKNTLRYVLPAMLVLSIGCIFAIKNLAMFDLPQESTLTAVIVLVILFGTMISPAYYIPMSIFSIEYGGPHSSTLVCLIDMSGFAASASFGFIIGRVITGSGGWPAFMDTLMLTATIAALSTYVFMNGEAKAESIASQQGYSSQYE
jgi:OPA family sugar phosphate sensor protein UhpC-like MFS transporter